MKHIFYLLTMVIFLYELRGVFGAKDRQGFLNEIEDWYKWDKKNGRQKHESRDDYQERQEKEFGKQSVQAYHAKGFFMIFYLIMLFIGLMTINWPIYAFMFCMGPVAGKVAKYSSFYIRLDSAISASLLVFALINAYHFKINIFQWIKCYINYFIN